MFDEQPGILSQTDLLQPFRDVHAALHASSAEALDVVPYPTMMQLCEAVAANISQETFAKFGPKGMLPELAG